MTVTIVGAKSFKFLKKIYGSTDGTSIYSQTKLDALKELINLAQTPQEIKELDEIIIHLQKYYNEANGNSHIVRQKIKEATLLYQERIERLKNGTKEPEKKKENNESNLIIVDKTFDFSRLDKIKEKLNAPEEKKTATGRQKYKYNKIDVSNLNNPEECIGKFIEAKSKVYKSIYLKKFIALEVSFEELLDFYNKYYNVSYKLRKNILCKLIPLAKTEEEKNKIKIITGQIKINHVDQKKKKKLNKEKENPAKIIEYWIDEFLENKGKHYKNVCVNKISKTNGSFEDYYSLYGKCKSSYTLKKALFLKLVEKIETIDHGIIVYGLTYLRNDRKAITKKIVLLINTKEDFERVKKLAPSRTLFWEECFENIIEIGYSLKNKS
jgi:hypothetical protein